VPLPDFLVLLVAAALIGAIAVARFAPGVRRLPVTLAAAAAALVAWPCWGRTAIAEADVMDRPIEVSADGYVSSSACRACHPHEHATWHDSHHRTMTQRAGPDTVLADWHGVTLAADGRQWRLERRRETIADLVHLDQQEPSWSA